METFRWYRVSLKKNVKEKFPFCFARKSHTDGFVIMFNGSYSTGVLEVKEAQEKYQIDGLVTEKQQELIEARYRFEMTR